MNIQVLSDLHLEHKPYSITIKNTTDVLVLAGDICPPKMIGRLDNALSKVRTNLPIIYVTGNHEYYGSSIDAVNEFWVEYSKKRKHFHFLNNSSIVIDGIQFVGSTLWSNFDTNDTDKDIDSVIRSINCSINDFFYIRKNGIGMTTTDCANMNEDSRKFIYNAISSYLGKSVLVTHFGVSKKSIHPKYQNSTLNSYFVCDCEPFITENTDKIPLVIHGHTHTDFEYNIANTRVVCNPRGYPGEKNTYKKQLIVNV